VVTTEEQKGTGVLARARGKAEKPSTQPSVGSKQAILNAALQAFARNGYDGASMPSIAKLAGVAPPLIHYYFETKEYLWRQTVDYSLGELRTEASAVLRATRSLAPLDRLRTLLQVYAEFAARCPDHFSMIVAEARADSDRFAWLQDNYTGVLFEEVVGILSDARDAGVVRDVPIKELAVILIGGILVHFTIYSSSQPPSSAGFVDLLFELLTKGVTT
jgi:AcrR family transcriptional regulator